MKKQILSIIILLSMFSLLFSQMPSDNLLTGTLDSKGLDNFDCEKNKNRDLLWSLSTLGSIYGTPAIDGDGFIYIGSYHSLYKISPSGNIEWIFPTNGWVTSSPTIDEEGTIYFGGGAENPPNPIPGWGIVTPGDNNLYAVYSDGSLKWTYNAGASIDYSSAALSPDGNTIYIATGVGNQGIKAIDTNTGDLLWHYPVAEWILSAPAVGNDGIIYVGTMHSESELLALNPNGSLRWSYDVAGWIVSSPAIDEDGTIYVGTMDTQNSVIALNPDGSLKWSYPAGYFICHSSPAIGIDRTIYIGTKDAQGNSLLALNPDDGTLKWSFTTGYWVESQITIGNTGTIYFSDMNGTFYALQDQGNQANVLWTFNTCNWTRAGSAIKDSILYFGSYDNNLYALQVQDTSLFNSSWPKYQADNKNSGMYNSGATGITQNIQQTQHLLLLHQNYPNPFNPETKIQYSIPKDSEIELKIYNIKGELVKTLVDKKRKRGTYSVIWNGKDDNSRQLSSGVYFYRLKLDDKVIDTEKCLLLK